MRHPSRAWRIGAAVLVLSGAAAVAQAAGVVGTGTPASCTEGALNAALAGGGSVTFNCGGGATVIPVTATKTLTTTTTIDGAGQNIVLDGGGTARLFRTTYQFTQFTITFRNLTLRNGRAADYGGAIRLDFQEPTRLTIVNIENVTFQNNVCDQAGNDVGGGALYAQSGIVTIRNSTFTGNRGGNGGAIGNLQARFTIEDSVFSGNTTNAHVGDGGNGGAIYIDGSGGGQLVVRRSSFLNNTASWIGGAFHTYLYAGGTGMTVEDSTFQGNDTYANGGAIYHQNGTLAIVRSTFSGNTTRGQGGALWLLQASTVTISNSTFTGNQATGIPPNFGSSGLGGAILINGQNNVTISHTTIASNHADWVGGGITGGMGSSSTTLRGTIVSNNTADNGGNPWNIQHNCSTQLLDGGGNLQFPARNPNDGNDTNCTAVIAIADPLLGPLASNGGYTQTRALGPGSPARNRVTTGCPPPTTDQRGVTRPQGGACDAGAYEAGPVVGAASLSVSEGSGGSVNAVFNLTLTEASTQPVTVAVQTANGTALAGSDYTAVSGTVTFPPGITAATRSVPITTDTIDEFDETFTLALSSPVNATLGSPSFATATIVDEDDPPTLGSGDCIAAEGTGTGGSCVPPVLLSGESGKPITVAYATANGTATAPEDYAARSGTLTLPPGSLSGGVPLSFAGDAQDETDEIFTIALSNAQNAAIVDPQGVITIDDDDGPGLSASSPAVVEGNAGTVNASFAMTLSSPSVQDVVVSYVANSGTATVGQDFQPASGSVTFPAGITARSVSVPVLGDALDEPNETFYLTLGPVMDAAPAAADVRATIVDDDGASFALQALDHGSDRRDTLEGGPDVFVLHQAARSAWEVRVDAASGDVGNGAGPLVERVAPDLATVLQPSAAIGTGPARTLRFTNGAAAPQDQYVRVTSAACASACGADDVYRVRAYDATGRIARWNAANGQVTVVVLQNTTNAPIAFSAHFWSPGGALLDTRPGTIPARGMLTFDSGGVPGIAGQAGSISVVHDAGYGGLAGKAVSLDPAAGFSFDTPLTYRPR